MAENMLAARESVVRRAMLSGWVIRLEKTGSNMRFEAAARRDMLLRIAAKVKRNALLGATTSYDSWQFVCACFF